MVMGTITHLDVIWGGSKAVMGPQTALTCAILERSSVELLQRVDVCVR